MTLKILLTNDDGFNSPGLLALESELKKWGDCFIAAPLTERSASGHGVTLISKIRVKKIFNKRELMGYAIDGTPADCVKFALKMYYQNDLPDLVISGINPGPNMGASIYYSGTIAAAREAIFSHIPAFAVSLNSYLKKGFKKYTKIVIPIIKKIYQISGKRQLFYNINIPTQLPKPKGIRSTHQSHSRFEEVFIPAGKNGATKADYYLKGNIELLKETGLSDEEAVREGYVSVTPCQLDVTSYREIKRLEKSFSRK